MGSSSLSGAARQLEAYTKALADIATGKSSTESDSARSQLITSGKSLLAELGPGDGVADAGLDLAGQAMGSIIAAKHNKMTREFLDRMDSVMPLMMERLGTGARLAVLQAALNRSRATNSLSKYGNRVLNDGRKKACENRDQRACTMRLQQFDDVALRLNNHNTAFLALRRSDPMIAARGFARSHKALRDIYFDPRANRQALAEGLAAFQESASALAEALEETDND